LKGAPRPEYKAFGRVSLPLVPLVPYILGNSLLAAVADRTNKIGLAPQKGLPVIGGKLLVKLFSQESGGHCLVVVNHRGQLHLRRSVKHNVDVVPVGVNLPHFAWVVFFQYPAGQLYKPCSQVFLNDRMPVFRNSKVVGQVITAVPIILVAQCVHDITSTFATNLVSDIIILY